MTNPEGVGELREKIARLIDPLPFADDWVGMPQTRADRKEAAFDRADAIQALLDIGRGGEGDSAQSQPSADAGPTAPARGGSAEVGRGA